ncbi:esterase-like activity of phytase family protein [Bifidobacterium aquikefiricola]|uniref:Esterase-like activity of phytase family protein n=1 Tax=Bifidobacterium aquikefiricola TaxID=3059038 RepID=A0AB39U590_9BIFI
MVYKQRHMRASRWLLAAVAVATCVTATNLAAVMAPTASAAEATNVQATAQDACSAHIGLSGYSDALDGVQADGVEVGGLSSLAWDQTSGSYVSSLDNNGKTSARIWFIGGNLASPKITGSPIILKHADGTPYDGTNSDNEGLAVLPDGNFMVSSETEPSIRIYNRQGIQQQELAVPSRFDVAPAGEATDNLTLEGVSVSPAGHEVIASMEGSLSGDGVQGTSLIRRFLVYRDDQAGAAGQWKLTKQVAFNVADGAKGVSDIALLSDDSALVLQRSYNKTTGNDIILSKISAITTASDVSNVANLSSAPASDFVPATTLGDLVNCSTLNAPLKPGAVQKNPLMDNYEGLAITKQSGNIANVSLISDNNFNPTQTTRVLNLNVDTAVYESDTNQPDLMSILSGFSSLWQASNPFDSKNPSTFGVGVVKNAQILKENDDLTQAINNKAAEGSTSSTPSKQVQRALVDSDYELGETLPDSLGPVLGTYLNQGIAKNQLPLFTKLFMQTDASGYGVSTLGDYVSTSKPKKAYNHPRPYVDRTKGGYPAAGLETSVPIVKAPVWTSADGNEHDPSYNGMLTSGSFPSGHTTYATSGAVGLATLLPELAPEILARGSEAGNNRIVLGVHYPLDIIGGRMDGDAANAARWSDPEFVKDQLMPARAELVNYLTAQCKANGEGSTLAACITATKANGTNGYSNDFVDVVSKEAVTDRASAIKVYENRMTYGFSQVGTGVSALQKAASTSVANVPTGAENLLITTYPTLSSAQRREVLAMTALPVSDEPLQAESQGYYNLDLAAAMSSTVQLDSKGNVVKVIPGAAVPSVQNVSDNGGSNGGSNSGSNGGSAPTPAPTNSGNGGTPNASKTPTQINNAGGETASKPLASTGANVSLIAAIGALVLLIGGSLVLIRRHSQLFK